MTVDSIKGEVEDYSGTQWCGYLAHTNTNGGNTQYSKVSNSGCTYDGEFTYTYQVNESFPDGSTACITPEGGNSVDVGGAACDTISSWTLGPAANSKRG